MSRVRNKLFYSLICQPHLASVVFEQPFQARFYVRVEKLEVSYGRCIVPCQQWQDIAEELPQEIAARLLPPETKQKEAGLPTQISLAPADLSATERAVFNLLSADEATHIDDLAAQSKLSVPELTGALLGLEMRELIRQLPGKCFVRKL